MREEEDGDGNIVLYVQMSSKVNVFKTFPQTKKSCYPELQPWFLYLFLFIYQYFSCIYTPATVSPSSDSQLTPSPTAYSSLSLFRKGRSPRHLNITWHSKWRQDGALPLASKLGKVIQHKKQLPKSQLSTIDMS